MNAIGTMPIVNICVTGNQTAVLLKDVLNDQNWFMGMVSKFGIYIKHDQDTPKFWLNKSGVKTDCPKCSVHANGNGVLAYCQKAGIFIDAKYPQCSFCGENKDRKPIASKFDRSLSEFV